MNIAPIACQTVAFGRKSAYRQRMLEQNTKYEEKLLNVEKELDDINRKIEQSPKDDAAALDKLYKQRVHLQRQMLVVEDKSCQLKGDLFKYKQKTRRKT